MRGVWFAVGAYTIWGLMPMYMKLLAPVPALQIVGHRVIWSGVMLVATLLALGRLGRLRPAREHRVLLASALAAIMIATNWLLYVWSVNAGFVLETSLGYFINPLVSVLLGVMFLGERLRPLQWAALAIAAAGVLYLGVAYGDVPWIALGLALSFGFYGLIKKTASLGALEGLTMETLLLWPVAIVYLAVAARDGHGAFLEGSAQTDLLLFGAGLITSVPLLLFGAAAQRMSLTLLGVIQYLAPSLQFLLGVFLYHEPLTRDRFAGFACVWLALALFAAEGMWVRRRTAAAR